MLPLNVDEANYSRVQCYCRSKLANAMYANYLSRKLAAEGIQTASVHPGAVITEISRHVKRLAKVLIPCMRPFLKTPWEGAQTTLYTALAPELDSGSYYADCKVAKPLPIVFDEKAQEDMIAASRKAVGLE
ncbi:unnamed protein product [Hymenolepis diminuta]|uniref:Retinol dehydrogenase 14 n=2 Tax=Hymenolepis diminuta TaxID=6216 RepID=A0A3P7BG20_HYMDI|nr:unnamed protein product [Hymenolepis diminuta]